MITEEYDKVDDGSEKLQLKQDEALLKNAAFGILERSLIASMPEPRPRQPHRPLDTLSHTDLQVIREIMFDELLGFHLRSDDAKAATERIITRIISTAAPSAAGEGEQ